MHKKYTVAHTKPARPGPRLLLAWAIALLALCYLVPAASTHAQSPTWLERSTQYFDILYTPGNEAYAEAYAGFVDGIYEDISTTFDHRTETPLTIHLYPSFETYHEVNPTAKDMPGVVAHADFRRRMLAVVLPQTQQQTPEEIQNNIRHELTHIVAAELSNNRLNTGFQEGIAQYNELPSPELERKKNLLARSLENNGLMDWSSFDNRENIYGYPEQGYPQTLATVAFLIETYGFDKFRAFLINSGASSGYRSALEATYGIPASELESQWKAWLPTYIDGTSAQNAAAGYDLSYPRRLLDAGRYGEARAELEQTVEWLRSTPQEDLLAEAEKLLIRSRAGEKAEELATEARSALVAADYESASHWRYPPRTGACGLCCAHRPGAACQPAACRSRRPGAHVSPARSPQQCRCCRRRICFAGRHSARARSPRTARFGGWHAARGRAGAGDAGHHRRDYEPVGALDAARARTMVGALRPLHAQASWQPAERSFYHAIL
jgi:hypothetical protein